MDMISLRRRNLRAAIDATKKKLGFKKDADFCAHYDLNPSQISQLVNAHGSFGELAARNLEKKIGWESGFLDRQIADDHTEIAHSNVVPVTVRLAPVLSWVQAGVFTNVQSVDMSQVEEWLPLPEDCEDCFYLKVQGLSNYPTFHEGDYILVDPHVPYCDMQSGDLVVVRKHDDATFKRLVIETDGARYLQALNPDFKPNIIPLDEDCIFVGEVIDSIRYIYRAKRKSKLRIH